MAALEDLITAVNANTAELQRLVDRTEKLVALRTEAIETVKSSAAPEKKAEKPKAEPKPKAEKPAAEEKPKADPKPASPVDPDALQATVDGGDTPDADYMKSAVAAYINYGGSEESPVGGDEREARKAKVKELLANPKVDAKTVAEMREGVRKAFLKKIIAWMQEIDAAKAAPESGADSDVDDL